MTQNTFKTLKIGIIGLIALIFISQNSFALELKPYAGASAKYNIEEFESNSDYDNAFGHTFALGTFITKQIAVEFQFEKIRDFGTKNAVTEEEVDVKSYTLNFKYYPVKENNNIRGYVRAGLGWMENEPGDHSILKGKSDRETGLCMKLGGGCDFEVSKVITFFLDASYTEGYNDLNPISYFSGEIGFRVFPF